jgi:hypothetical protein
LQTVIDAINAATPAGHARSYADVDRIELARIDGLGSGSGAFGCRRGPDIRFVVGPEDAASYVDVSSVRNAACWLIIDSSDRAIRQRT